MCYKLSLKKKQNRRRSNATYRNSFLCALRRHATDYKPALPWEPWLLLLTKRRPLIKSRRVEYLAESVVNILLIFISFRHKLVSPSMVNKRGPGRAP